AVYKTMPLQRHKTPLERVAQSLGDFLATNQIKRLHTRGLGPRIHPLTVTKKDNAMAQDVQSPPLASNPSRRGSNLFNSIGTLSLGIIPLFLRIFVRNFLFLVPFDG
ncbi:hypothetical protein J6590_069108, partial [Homalodisca vitripennis]